MKPLLIVDGYNVIGAWSEAEKKGWSLDESRDRLMRQLEDYAGFSGEEILLVFDGYQSERTTTTEEKHGDLTLVFTRHGETADSYIERAAAQTPRYRELRGRYIGRAGAIAGAVQRRDSHDQPGTAARTS